MGLNLSTNLPMFFYTFQAMWRHRPLEKYLVFVGIRAAHTSYSPFTLVLATVTQPGMGYYSQPAWLYRQHYHAGSVSLLGRIIILQVVVSPCTLLAAGVEGAAGAWDGTWCMARQLVHGLALVHSTAAGAWDGSWWTGGNNLPVGTNS